MKPRGAKPLPTSVKALRGTLRPGRRNPNEPRVTVAIPKCPPHLSDEAKREWRRTSKELAAMGLLATIDRGALALYCEAWGRWVEAEEALKKFGVVLKSPNGYPLQSPYLAIANKAMEQMRALLSEFGMSPSSRARVHAIPPPPEDSALERLMRRKEEAG